MCVFCALGEGEFWGAYPVWDWGELFVRGGLPTRV
jgi:hypothetical protein